MIQRDFLLREVARLAQALALVLFHKRTGHADEAQDALGVALREVTGQAVDDLRGLDRAAVLALCDTPGGFSPERAVALADLLREDAEVDGRQRAAWLYEAALAAGAPVPFDVAVRVGRDV